MMEYKMKTTLLLTTLAVGLVGATSAFAQATTSGPAYPYPQGYQETRPAAPAFGPSDYGYYQGRVGTGHVQAPRARNRAPLSAIEPIDEVR
jgi:hypothetical protein